MRTSRVTDITGKQDMAFAKRVGSGVPQPKSESWLCCLLTE